LLIGFKHGNEGRSRKVKEGQGRSRKGLARLDDLPSFALILKIRVM